MFKIDYFKEKYMKGEMPLISLKEFEDKNINLGFKQPIYSHGLTGDFKINFDENGNFNGINDISEEEIWFDSIDFHFNSLELELLEEIGLNLKLCYNGIKDFGLLSLEEVLSNKLNFCFRQTEENLSNINKQIDNFKNGNKIAFI